MLSPLSSRPLRPVGALGLLILFPLLWGCGSEPDTDLGAWTMTTGDLALEKELQVSETESYFFGSISDLDVTTEGQMVVLDGEATHLKILRPDGTLIDTLGREGQGPGEFQRPRSVDVARGDSVYVFDVLPDRLTVFTPPPSAERARSVTVPGDRGAVTKVQVLGDRLAGRFTPGYTRKEGLRRPSPATWRVLRETGMPGGPLLKAQRRKVATSFKGSGAAIAYLPLGRVTRVAAGADSRLYHGLTDSLRVRATSLDGTTEAVATVPADPIPVTEADRDSALAEVEADIRRPIEAALPETKPAFTDLVVADDGRLWMERPAKGPDAETVPWWVLDPETKTIRELHVPSAVDLRVVQDGYAYGSTTTDTGAPAVVRYTIQRTN